jgi:hypothetical protein
MTASIAKIALQTAAMSLSLIAMGTAGLATTEVARAQATSSPLYGPNGLSPLAVRQGKLGSCYFHSSIAALAKAVPDTLRKAIVPEADGAYRVHFFDGSDEVVFPEEVQFATAQGLDLSEGAWVKVLMRAYAQRVLRASLKQQIEKSEAIPVFVRPMALSVLNQNGGVLVAYDRAIRMVVTQNGDIDKNALKAQLVEQAKALGVPASASTLVSGFLDESGFFESLAQTVRQNGEFFGVYRSLGQGGIPWAVMTAFVGSAHAGLVKDQARTLAQLRQLGPQNIAMVAGTVGQPGAFDPGNWWVGGHAFTVLGYDDSTQSVSLRNPWGGHPGPDGTFSLPVSVFLVAFESYTASGEAGQ